MPDDIKNKSEIKELAGKVIDLLRPEGLELWQVKEVLVFATEQLEHEKLKQR